MNATDKSKEVINIGSHKIILEKMYCQSQMFVATQEWTEKSYKHVKYMKWRVVSSEVEWSQIEQTKLLVFQNKWSSCLLIAQLHTAILRKTATKLFHWHSYPYLISRFHSGIALVNTGKELS